jgi:uncharacterized protein (DUF927 family)
MQIPMRRLLRKNVQLAALCLATLLTPAHANNMAIKCEFAILKQAHETLIFCGEKINPANEARYQTVANQFESFIASNADSKPDWQESVEEIRRGLLREDKDRVCKDQDYQKHKRMFSLYVSDSGMAYVKKLLSRPRDPSKGDCF